MATSNTMVSFDTSKTTYALPDTLEINPDFIIDERDNTYVVSLGRANLTDVEAAMYEPLFNALDTRLTSSNFITGISFIVNDKVLTFDIAYVSRRQNKYGRFYDIEAMCNEATYKDYTERKSRNGANAQSISRSGKKNMEPTAKRSRTRR